MRVEGILAHDRNYVIGRGDRIPWNHRGDLARFQKITMGHSLLMGAKTFFGIAKNYFRGSETVLPGRTLYVLGKPRNPLGESSLDEFRSVHKRGYGSDWVQLVHEALGECRSIGVGFDNVRIVLDEGGPRSVLDKIEMNYLMKGETLFVAGGAKTYHEYLPFASKIHLTVIEDSRTYDDALTLTSETINLLSERDRFRDGTPQICGGVYADFFQVLS